MNNIFRRLRTVDTPKPTVGGQPKPSMACDTNSTFVYTTGADVQKIWRKHGWTPPSEYRNDYLFKKNREMS